MGRILQWTGCVVSLAAALMSGVSSAFSVYALSLKETFQYSQSEVELVFSFGAAGMGLCFLQPIVTSRFGYQVTYVIALVFAPIACLRVYVGTLYPGFFSQWPILIGLFLLLADMSSRMFQLQIFQISVNNFDKKYSGKIIGIYSGLGCLGKMFFCALYDMYFNGNLGRVFIVIAMVYAVNSSLCMLLHRPVSKEDEIIPSLKRFDTAADKLIPGTNNENKRTEEEDGVVDVAEEKEFEMNETSLDIGVKFLLKSRYFHLMFWSSVMLYSATMSFVGNLTIIGVAAKANDPFAPLYVVSVTMALSRMLVGPIYDFFQSDKHGFILLFFTYLCFSIAMTIGLTCFNQTGLYVMAFLVGVSSAGGSTLPFAMLSSQFGRHNLSSIMGGFWGIGFFVIFLMQMFIGFSYDREILAVDVSGRFCRGVHCFRNSLLMLLFVVMSIVVVQIVNLVMLLRKGRQYWVLGQPS